ncbi:MAG TPA: PAS domain-containing protein [Nevskia sp.]|nr:PAS domain-containing protein [Nevskia sp.]
MELALRAGDMGHWDIDLVRGSSRRSPRHDQCFGYASPVPETEWGLDTFLRHVHPDDRAAVESGLRDAINRLDDWRAEFRVLWPDGSQHWLEASGTPYSVEAGSARRMLGVVADITPRKQGELESARHHAALLESERRLRLAIDTMPSLTWFGRADGAVVFLNEQWRRYTGLATEDGLGRGWARIIHPDDLADLDARWTATLRTGEPGEHEARVRRFDGEYRWFLLVWVPLLDASGSVVAWFGSNTDIEERQRTEQMLRASAHVARRQVEILKSSLDALSREADPTRLAGHILGSIIRQFGAHSGSVWARDSGTDTVALQFAFEDGHVVHRDDPRFAGLDPRLPMENAWPWPEVFRNGTASVIEDIRDVPSFPLRDRLVPMGIVTVLFAPMAVMGHLEGAVALRFTTRRSFSSEEVELAVAFASQLMLAIQLTRLSQESRESAVLAERNRIARDIHDTLAQGFTGVIVQLEAAEDAKLRELGDEADQHIRRAIDLARDSLKEARRSVGALRPTALETGTLCNALPAMLERMVAGTGLELTFAIEGTPFVLPSDWESDLLRIGQEVLTNVLRHARANRFQVLLAFACDSVRLELGDDGIGFDPAARRDGFGLRGMQERASNMGGALTITSRPGDGTRIAIAVPLP